VVHHVARSVRALAAIERWRWRTDGGLNRDGPSSSSALLRGPLKRRGTCQQQLDQQHAHSVPRPFLKVIVMHSRNGASRAKIPDRNGPQGDMQSVAASQLTLNFEPALPERFPTLREFVAFRVQELKLNEKTLASDMDLSPTVLSRKLRPSDHDTSRLTVDDLEAYIRATRDTTPLEYLAAKFMDSPDGRKARALSRFETILSQAEDAMRLLRSAA
jgi:hypothetical protein